MRLVQLYRVLVLAYYPTKQQFEQNTSYTYPVSEFIFQIVLPLALVMMMFTMGLSLSIADFARVFKRPVAFSLGAFNQILVLPVIAFAMIGVFDLDIEFAVGMMILAACPGGIVSNVISYLGRADAALSVSLTACVSLLSLITMPLLVAFSINHFDTQQNIADFPYLRLVITLLVITIIPVLSGILLRKYKYDLANALLPTMDKLTGIFFIIVVVAAIASNWNDVLVNLPMLGTVLISYSILLLLWGLLSARLVGLPIRSTATIAIETSVQNVATAILICSTVLQNDAYYIPAALYGVLMYGPSMLLVIWMRKHFSN